MRYHFGYAKAEVLAMPWYDAQAHREYLAQLRGEGSSSPRIVAPGNGSDHPANRRFEEFDDGRAAAQTELAKLKAQAENPSDDGATAADLRRAGFTVLEGGA